MADPHPPSEPIVPEREPKRPGTRRKPSPTGSTFWYLMIFGVLLAVAITAFRGSLRGEELSFREFASGVESGRFHSGNVFELTVGQEFISFQDQPRDVTEPTEPDTPPVIQPSLPTVEGAGDATGEAADVSAEDSATSEQPQPTAASEAPASTERPAARRFHLLLSNLPEDKITGLLNLLDERNIDYSAAPTGVEWATMMSFLLLLVFVAVMIYFMRRMGGAGSAMSFGRSRGRLIADDDVKITFDDVAGINEAVDELREIVEFLRTPAKYQALGGRIPRGVLLVGPPGTGKTLLAKAVAGEAGVPFFSLSGSDFVEMFVGVGAARVRDMFAQAVQRAPSIIFIDELDALGKTRGSGMPGGHDEREQTLNALLVEMDGFSSDQSVIVMGATNRPETLDPALMRPGRFDRHVLVDRPDYKGREAILKVHAAKIKLDDKVNLIKIAKLTPGFVGADLANLVNEAALLAARSGKSSVGMREFEEGIERVIAGLERTSRIIHQDEKQRVAYHECGHALVASSLPHTDPVHKISIIPRGMGALGYMMQRPEDDRHLVTQTELQHRICVLLGGIAAEEIVFEEISTGAQNDLERATDIARRMVTEFGMSPKMGRVNYHESRRSPFLSGATSAADHVHSEHTTREIDLEVKRIIDESMQTARDVLRGRRPALEQMTRELIEVEVMDADQLQRILDQHKTGPQLKPGTYIEKPATPAGAGDDHATESSSREAADGA